MSSSTEQQHHMNECFLNPVDVEESFRKLSLKDTAGGESGDLPEDAKRLLESMKYMECPFTWLPKDMACDVSTISRCEEKAKEIIDDDFKWRVFVVNLVLCYEYSCNKLSEDAAAKLRELEAYVKEYEGGGKDAKKDVQVSKVALKHMVLSCKCSLEFKDEHYSGARSTLQEIEMIKINEKERATIWGTKAAVYMEYGYYGTKAAVGFCEKALEVDPDQSEWHFLLGKALGRIRRMTDFSGLPETRELSALEKAVSSSEKVPYMIFLAQAYRESAYRIYSINKENMSKYKTICKEMNERSSALYRKALECDATCARSNIRCGLGLLKLPKPYRDIELAKVCVMKALNMTPNNAMAHHTAGFYYELCRDLDKAKFHYLQATNFGAFGAFFDYMRIMICENPDFNPLPTLEKILLQFKEQPRQHEILCQMGSYCYFIKNDFREALTFWLRILDEDPTSVRLEVHKSTFVQMKVPVSISRIIFDESRLFLEQNLGTPQERTFMRKLVIKYVGDRPEFANSPPVSHRDIVMKTARRNNSKSRVRDSGHGQSWKGVDKAGSQRGGRNEMKQSFVPNSSRGRGEQLEGCGSRDLHNDRSSTECQSNFRRYGDRDSSLNSHSENKGCSSTSSKSGSVYGERSGIASSVVSGSSISKDWRLECPSGHIDGKVKEFRNQNRKEYFPGCPQGPSLHGSGEPGLDSNIKQYCGNSKRFESSSCDNATDRKGGNPDSSSSNCIKDYKSKRVTNWRAESICSNESIKDLDRKEAAITKLRTFSQSSVESDLGATRNWSMGCSGGSGQAAPRQGGGRGSRNFFRDSNVGPDHHNGNFLNISCNKNYEGGKGEN